MNPRARNAVALTSVCERVTRAVSFRGLALIRGGAGEPAAGSTSQRYDDLAEDIPPSAESGTIWSGRFASITAARCLAPFFEHQPGWRASEADKSQLSRKSWQVDLDADSGSSRR
jgi:hypothetical protein